MTLTEARHMKVGQTLILGTVSGVISKILKRNKQIEVYITSPDNCYFIFERKEPAYILEAV